MKEKDKEDVLWAVQEYIRMNVDSKDMDGLKQAIEKAMEDNYILESDRMALLDYLQKNIGVELVGGYGKLTIWERGGKCYAMVGQAIYMLKKKYTYMQSKARVDVFCGNDMLADSDEQTSKQPQQKKRGRQVKPFEACITIQDKVGLLDKMHQILKGKKGKVVYLVVNVLANRGVIPCPTYAQLSREFGDIGNESAKSRYKGLEAFTKEEIKGVENIFSCFLQ